MANNENRLQGPLRAGLIADAERIASLAAAVEQCDLLTPLAQAGMPQAAAAPRVPWLDDPRVLLANPELEAVLLASSTRQNASLAAAAAGRGLHVWHLPPLACTFAEGAEAVARAKRAESVWRVASWWEYVFEHVWHEVAWPADFQPLYSELRVSVRGPAHDSWRAGVAETAGGALADAGYRMLEVLVAGRGLPETAGGTVGQYRTPAPAATGAAEDTTLAILGYRSGTALVRAAWDQPPFGQQLLHTSAAVTALLTEEELVLLDRDGETLDRRPLPGGFLAQELLRFAEAVRGQARDRALATLDRHLAVSAVLEAVYLSARTGHAESPRKYYQVLGLPEPRS
ncbi:MAG: Gfo/Idh/MocA family oxidoreductase [Planctomycetota bacterium]